MVKPSSGRRQHTLVGLDAANIYDGAAGRHEIDDLLNSYLTLCTRESE